MRRIFLKSSERVTRAFLNVLGQGGESTPKIGIEFWTSQPLRIERTTSSIRIIFPNQIDQTGDARGIVVR